MKKKRSNSIRNLVRLIVILSLSMILSLTICHSQEAHEEKLINQVLLDAFAYKSMMQAYELDPAANGNGYTDITTLEEEDDSYVGEMAMKTGQSKYYIRVNYTGNCVTIFTKDDDGNYTKPYKAMICSSGKATPKSGTYKITYKYRWLRLVGGVYGQYSTRIVKSILFHSVPYFEQRADKLEYEEFDKLGTTASAGCIRLTVEDAKWIYDNIPSGTYVEFYSDKDNPGPLGKPTAQKISDNVKNRNWDPTDPDVNNPWNGGSGVPSVIYYQQPEYTNTSKNTTNTSTTTNTTQKATNTSKTNTSTQTTSQKDNTKPETSSSSQSQKKPDKKPEQETKPTTSEQKPEQESNPTTPSSGNSDSSGSQDNNSGSSGSTETPPVIEQQPSNPPAIVVTPPEPVPDSIQQTLNQ